jgi:pantothenate synthetase
LVSVPTMGALHQGIFINAAIIGWE